MNDYIYCVRGPERQIVEKNATAPLGICCKDYYNCPQAKDGNWSCSSAYSDKLLSLRVCPFKKAVCGDTPDVIFSNVGDMNKVNLTLYAGDVCLIQTRAECGLPAFEP